MTALMTSGEAAAYLGVKEGTMRTWRWLGRGPRPLKLSPGCVRYELHEVRAWARAHRVGVPR